MKLILICLTVIFYLGCSKTIYITEKNNIKDGQYDSEFPGQPTSEILEDINQSVKMVNTMSSYKGYEFSMKNGPLKSQLNDSNLALRALKEKYLNSPASGTATVIYHKSDKIALLTCNHVISSPDTIITYFLDKDGKKTPFIQSVYFKVRHSITVTGVPEVNDFEVLATDRDKDLAVVGKDYSRRQILNLSVFTYPAGRAEELRMGTFVYLFGFPRGERMVGSSIVSRSNKGRDHGFVLNAPMHKGISGGLVMAIRDGVPNFEWVGMVFAVAGERFEYLVPEQDRELQSVDIQRIYGGDIYMSSSRSIVYGITYAVSIESIQQFLEMNKDVFLSKGYNFEFFLTKRETIEGVENFDKKDISVPETDE